MMTDNSPLSALHALHYRGRITYHRAREQWERERERERERAWLADSDLCNSRRVADRLRGVVPIRLKQSRKVQTVLLVTRGDNETSKSRASEFTKSRLYCMCIQTAAQKSVFQRLTVQWSLYVCIANDHYMYRQWSLYVPPVVTICTTSGHICTTSGHNTYVSPMITICTASGHYMYHQRSLYVPQVVTMCTASGHYMYRQWSLYVPPV